MSQCVRCKKIVRKNDDRSVHIFPKIEEEKDLWIQNMQLGNIVLKPYSVLCSDHFEDCIDRRDNRSRLRKGSLPTVLERQEDGELIRIPNPVNNIMFLKRNSSPNNASRQPLQEIEVSPAKKFRSEIVQHDHVYMPSYQDLQAQIEQLKGEKKVLQANNKNLKQTVKRTKQKLESFSAIVKELRANDKLEEFADVLDTMSGLIIYLEQHTG